MTLSAPEFVPREFSRKPANLPGDKLSKIQAIYDHEDELLSQMYGSETDKVDFSELYHEVNYSSSFVHDNMLRTHNIFEESRKKKYERIAQEIDCARETVDEWYQSQVEIAREEKIRKLTEKAMNSARLQMLSSEKKYFEHYYLLPEENRFELDSEQMFDHLKEQRLEELKMQLWGDVDKLNLAELHKVQNKTMRDIEFNYSSDGFKKEVANEMYEEFLERSFALEEYQMLEFGKLLEHKEFRNHLIGIVGEKVNRNGYEYKKIDVPDFGKREVFDFDKSEAVFERVKTDFYYNKQPRYYDGKLIRFGYPNTEKIIITDYCPTLLVEKGGSTEVLIKVKVQVPKRKKPVVRKKKAPEYKVTKPNCLEAGEYYKKLLGDEDALFYIGTDTGEVREKTCLALVERFPQFTGLSEKALKAILENKLERNYLNENIKIVVSDDLLQDKLEELSDPLLRKFIMSNPNFVNVEEHTLYDIVLQNHNKNVVLSSKFCDFL